MSDDLCNVCKEEEHDVCGDSATCPCCRHSHEEGGMSASPGADKKCKHGVRFDTYCAECAELEEKSDDLLFAKTLEYLKSKTETPPSHLTASENKSAPFLYAVEDRKGFRWGYADDRLEVAESYKNTLTMTYGDLAGFTIVKYARVNDTD